MHRSPSRNSILTSPWALANFRPLVREECTEYRRIKPRTLSIHSNSRSPPMHWIAVRSLILVALCFSIVMNLAPAAEADNNAPVPDTEVKPRNLDTHHLFTPPTDKKS